VEHKLATFELNNKKNMKIPKHLMTLLITQNTHVKNIKIPRKAKLSFVFSKVKSVILLYMESEKT
jgi:Cu/Ag efflux protein CusF